MPSITMAEAVKLQQNPLIKGVVETIRTTDQLYNLLPWQECNGVKNWNKESVLGDVQVLGVGGTITAKNPATVVPASATLTTIIGDAEINGLIQATRSNTNDQKGFQVFSKAKSAGRQYRNMFINGTGLADQFPGLLSQVAAGQILAAGTNGANLSFHLLDQLMAKVKAKDGEVDFLSMPERTLLSFLELCRGANGAGLVEVISLPGGKSLHKYRGTPILTNDWIPTNQTQGTGTNCTTVVAGCFDDGSEKVGIAGLTAPGENFGIVVKDIGEKADADEEITRVKWYCGLANYNDYALAALRGILN